METYDNGHTFEDELPITAWASLHKTNVWADILGGLNS